MNSPLVHTTLDALVELHAQANRLDLSTRTVIHSSLPGMRKSNRRGSGMEFEELRDYRLGDDVRSIDWKVTQRTGKPYVRIHTQEFERDVVIVVDQSSSMFFGSKHRMKSVTAAHCAALVAWRALLDKDRAAAVVFNDSAVSAFDPQRSSAGVLQLLQHIVDANTKLNRALNATADTISDIGPNDFFNQALNIVGNNYGRDNLLIIISDFAGWTKESETLCKSLCAQNDVFLWSIYDPLERALPDTGSNLYSKKWLISDGDKQSQIDLQKSDLRKRYSDLAKQRAVELRSLAKDHGLPWREIDTLKPVIDQLANS